LLLDFIIGWKYLGPLYCYQYDMVVVIILFLLLCVTAVGTFEYYIFSYEESADCFSHFCHLSHSISIYGIFLIHCHQKHILTELCDFEPFLWQLIMHRSTSLFKSFSAVAFE
jgi:hypothetical protein